MTQATPNTQKLSELLRSDRHDLRQTKGSVFFFSDLSSELQVCALGKIAIESGPHFQNLLMTPYDSLDQVDRYALLDEKEEEAYGLLREWHKELNLLMSYIEGAVVGDDHKYVTLLDYIVYLNDDCGLSFAQIADWLEGLGY